MSHSKSDSAVDWPLRLLTVRKRLKLDQQQMGSVLGVEREWVSRLENGKGVFSVAVREAIERAEEQASAHKFSVSDDSGDYRKSGSLGRSKDAHDEKIVRGMVDPRFQPRAAPSSRADVEAYFRAYCEAAEASGDPDAFPAIMRQLKKTFPLDEFEPKKNQPP